MSSVNIQGTTDSVNVGKIVCVGHNYEEHIRELGNTLPESPVLFLKPPSNIIYSGENVIHPSYSENLHHEVELVLLIGKDIKDASEDEAEEAIWGYGVGLDMTLRDIQFKMKEKGLPWTLAKCFDTSAVLSSFIPKANHKLTFDETIVLKVNGEIRQNSKLGKMIFRPARLVSYISSVMRLEKGDLIFTGTPEGVSRVLPGDRMDAEITGLASLSAAVEYQFSKK